MNKSLSYGEVWPTVFRMLKDTYYHGSRFYKWNDSYYFDVNDVIVVIFLTLHLTNIRNYLEKVLFKISTKYSIPEVSKIRVSQNGFKLLYRMFLWPYMFHRSYFGYRIFDNVEGVVIVGENRVIQPFPWDVRIALQLEFSYYIQEIYRLLFVEARKKDTVLLLVHHALTMVGILVSYTWRYELCCLFELVLFQFDDLLLVFGKTLLYFKIQDGREVPWIRTSVSAIIHCLTVTWFLTRLYLLPLLGLKLIYDGKTFETSLGHEVTLLKLREVGFVVSAVLTLTLILFSFIWFTVLLRMSFSNIFCKNAEQRDETEIHHVTKNGKTN